MSFLQPLALFGLAAAALPALLHLLQRREPPTVSFPAVRYLAETERRHSRRLRLRHLLLLLLRTAVIVFLVLAAARPVARVPFGDAHAPSALAVVVDNSLSSGAVRDGRPTVELLVDRARRVLEAADDGDHIWLALADGVPRRVSRLEAMTALDDVRPEAVRLDLGAVVRAAARTVADDPLPGAVVVLSDLQASALSGESEVDVPVTVWRPPPPPANRWIDAVEVAPPAWTPAGRVIAAVGGAGNEPAEVRLELDGRLLARGLAAPGEQVTLAATLPASGWRRARLVLGADEFRDDDERWVALRAAPARGAVVEGGAGPFVAEAVDVLRAAGRVAPGGDVTLADRPTGGPTVVVPPADPARLGAVNRQLAARGIGWRFGDVTTGEWQLAADVPGLAGHAVRRRVGLEGRGEVLATVQGAPWLVREGDVVLIGSRLDTAWTALPVSAGFVPFLDFLINRGVVGVATRLTAAPGAPVPSPAGAAALVGTGGRTPVTPGGDVVAPAQPGVFFFVGAAGDTVGVLEVNHDVRESRLEVALPAATRAVLGSQTAMRDDEDLLRGLFPGARRADLSTVLLVLAALAAVAEFALASLGGRRAAED